MSIGPLEVAELLVVLVIPAWLGWKLGKARNHPTIGLVLGLLLSWIGVLITLLLHKTPPARDLDAA